MPRLRAGPLMDTASRRRWSTVEDGSCVWFYGALRVCDGHALTLSAPARNTAGYLQLLKAIDLDNPTGDLYLVADNLSSHKSPPIQAWLAEHPRVQQVFIPTKAGSVESARGLVAPVSAGGAGGAGFLWGR